MSGTGRTSRNRTQSRDRSELDRAETDSDAAPSEAYVPRPAEGGCGRWALMLLLVLAGVVAGTIWGAHTLVGRHYARELNAMFETVSLKPDTGKVAIPAEQEIKIYSIVRSRVLAPRSVQLREKIGRTELVHRIAEEIVAPSENGQQHRFLPQGTRIQSVFMVNDVVWLDLSGPFLSSEKATPRLERLVVYAMVNSFLLNEPRLKAVQFMVDGRPIETAWGWLDTSTPLGPDLSLLQ